MPTINSSKTHRLAMILSLLAVCIVDGVLGQTRETRTPPPAVPVLQAALNASSRGSDKAPITVLVFSDFESFLCARSAFVLGELLAQTRDVHLIFKHAPAATNPNAILAHEAALAAGAQGKFWEMHDVLFANQAKLSRDDLIKYANQIGLKVPAFRQAIDDHAYRFIIESNLAEARALGVTTTPTFFVNGRRMVGPQGQGALAAVLHSLLDGVPEGQRVHEEIVTSGPAQTIDLAHAPALGPVSAPISLVEFSDFQCPFCAEAASVVHQLLIAYPTQVRFDFKHYPLPIHKESPLAHEAALAAAEQGKFWEMHDLLFATQDKLKRDDLIAKAKQLDLDVDRFTKDLDSHRFKPTIESDRREGSRLGVNGTPYFFINGHAFSGGADISAFKRLIETAIKESAPPATKSQQSSQKVR